MFASLTERMSDVVRHLTGRGRITEENVRDTVRAIRMALLEADVALPVAKSFIDRVRDRAIGDEVARSLNPGQAFTKIVHDELVRTLGEEPTAIATKGRPSIVLLVGLQGAGKTTTAGKLARHLSRGAESEVLLASTDVYRPAAREQLGRLARDLGAGFFETGEGDPIRIATEAVAEAKRRNCRWLIIDTAGRLHVDAEMMAEVGAIQSAVAPTETLFVLDAMSGQDAVNSARAFNEAVALTGAILTKTDGDARGGAALSMRAVTGVPIKLMGTGEKLDALEAFAPARFAARILGMGDIVGLVEEVHAKIDRDAAERVAGKVKRGRDLDLDALKEQLEQIAKLGGLESLLEVARDSSRRCAVGGIRCASAPPADRTHRFDDAAGARTARAHRRLTQAPHCRRGGSLRARCQPSPEAAQAARQDDEACCQAGGPDPGSRGATPSRIPGSAVTRPAGAAGLTLCRQNQ